MTGPSPFTVLAAALTQGIPYPRRCYFLLHWRRGSSAALLARQTAGRSNQAGPSRHGLGQPKAGKASGVGGAKQQPGTSSQMHDTVLGASHPSRHLSLVLKMLEAVAAIRISTGAGKYSQACERVWRSNPARTQASFNTVPTIKRWSENATQYTLYAPDASHRCPAVVPDKLANVVWWPAASASAGAPKRMAELSHCSCLNPYYPAGHDICPPHAQRGT